MGRPSEFSSDAETEILDIIRGGGTLEKAAEAASVSARTILRWLEADSEFRRKYAQAREDQPGDAIRFADLRFNWKKKCEGLPPAEMRRLKQLEDERANRPSPICSLIHSIGIRHTSA